MLTPADLHRGWVAITLLTSLALISCGSDQLSAANAGGSAATVVGVPPTISGTPQTSVAEGSAYRFQPAASSASGAHLTFTIKNMPVWASFSAATGALSGTPGPADVKLDSNIQISVSDATATATLSAFSINVLPNTSAINGACGTANGIAVSAAPTKGLCTVGVASSVTGTGPWYWTCSGSNGGRPAQCAAPKLVTPPGSSATLHYTANGNFDSKGHYLPAADGFNLADVSNVGTVNALPSGVLGLVWVGQCNGADAQFIAAIRPYIGNMKVFGFYLMDEPDPSGQYAPRCPAANLLAESDWIHANAPGSKTFIVMMNLGSPTNPSFLNTYNPGNTDIDLFGLDPYPVRPEFPGGVNYGVIGAGVHAAIAAGIPVTRIVPVFQAFGGGEYTSYTLPSAAQEKQILATWDALIPSPVFDYTYSWGSQASDESLATTPALQPIFLHHNTSAN